MDYIKNLYTELITAFTGHPLEILLVKTIVVLVAIFISWIILRWVVKVFEQRLIKYTFIQENRKIFSYDSK